MQERTLARRIVHILPDETMWHCQTTSCCECGIEPRDSVEFDLSLSLFARRDKIESGIMADFKFGHAWTEVLFEYLRLEMTVLTDTLPALSGLAKSVEYLKPGQYIAGLWERGIAFQLSWYSESEAAHRLHLDGPSFSWVTAQRQVCWSFAYNHYDLLCTFVTSTSMLATANPYGHVTACSITLKGRTLAATQILFWLDQNSTSSPNLSSTEIYMDDSKSDLHLLLKPVDSGAGGQIANVLGFILYKSKDRISRPVSLTVLLLQRDTNATHYKRIGIMLGIDAKWFPDNQPEETIIVI
jgi:hypothetical protein